MPVDYMSLLKKGYKVKEKDTWYSIARNLLGSATQAPKLKEFNAGVTTPTPGMIIEVPVKEAPQAITPSQIELMRMARLPAPQQIDQYGRRTITPGIHDLAAGAIRVPQPTDIMLAARLTPRALTGPERIGAQPTQRAPTTAQKEKIRQQEATRGVPTPQQTELLRMGGRAPYTPTPQEAELLRMRQPVRQQAERGPPPPLSYATLPYPLPRVPEISNVFSQATSYLMEGLDIPRDLLAQFPPYVVLLEAQQMILRLGATTDPNSPFYGATLEDVDMLMRMLGYTYDYGLRRYNYELPEEAPGIGLGGGYAAGGYGGGGYRVTYSPTGRVSLPEVSKGLTWRLATG